MGLSLKILGRFSPRAPRAALVIDTWMLLPDDRLVQVLIKNISPAGFMGETSSHLEPGMAFGIVIPRQGIFRGSIRWSDAGEIGGKFDRPVNLACLENLPLGEVERCGFAEVRVRQPLL